jgi:hypothetical protein
MPEYLYPGVYVEAYDLHPKPIPGVETLTQDVALRQFVAEVLDVVRRAQPDWTDRDTSDPAITLLELVAWLSEVALCHADSIPEQGRRAALRAIGALAAFSSPPCGQDEEVLLRPRYFTGQLLSVADLQLEQDYLREKLRRHNRALHGVGIVRGLGVSIEAATDAADGRLRVEPGYAIDPCGNELALGRGAVLALPEDGERLFVSMRHWDRPCSPVPSTDGESMPSRIEEVCVVALVDTVVEPAIALAQLLHTEGQWLVDPAFVPPRLRCCSTGE